MYFENKAQFNQLEPFEHLKKIQYKYTMFYSKVEENIVAEHNAISRGGGGGGGQNNLDIEGSLANQLNLNHHNMSSISL